MALRDQPYIPLYVQDYMSDEKLNMCSWKAQGIYIKILCVLHKQEEYGKILFKQNSKQKESNIEYYASYLIRQIPCERADMVEALEELIENGVMIITDTCIYQKRMVSDGEISMKRSIAAKKGGGNPNLFKQNDKQTYKQHPKQTFKQKDKQNTEYEYENEYEYKDEINKGVIGGKEDDDEDEKIEENDEIITPEVVEDVYLFDHFWDDYDKKVGDKQKLRKKWEKISDNDKIRIRDYIPRYKAAQPDKKYRKNPETFLNNKSWNDEIIEENGKRITNNKRAGITDDYKRSILERLQSV